MKAFVCGLLLSAFALMRSVCAGAMPFADDYNVRSLTMSDGLSHVFIDDLFMDSEGFVWVATAGGGLSRYDAYGFVEFGPGKEKRSLKGNCIIKLTEDEHRRLWVASREGLDIVDLNALACCKPVDDTGRLDELMERRTFYVATDAEGRIWINNIDGIVCVTIDRQNGHVIDIAELSGVYHEPNLLVIADVLSDGSPWVLVDGVVYRLSVSNDGKVVMMPVSDVLRFDNPELTALCMAVKDGEVWIATSHGLLRYNPIDDKVRRYTSRSDNPRSLSHDYVSSVVVMADGRLVAGSSGGLDVYSSISDDFDRVSKNMLDDNAIWLVNCLLADGAGRLWVGTEQKGINLLVPRMPGVKAFIHNESDSSSISPSQVNAVCDDKYGNWWIATVERGLDKVGPDFAKFEHYSWMNTDLSRASIMALGIDRDSCIWIGTWGRGIDVIECDNPFRKSLHIETTNDAPNMVKFVTMLKFDAVNDLMWIGTNRGLVVYDIRSGELSEPFVGAASDAAWMLDGAMDSDGNFWLGGKYGLFKIDINSRDVSGHFKVKHYGTRLDDAGSKILERLSAVCVTKDGTLWLGSSGNGIYRREVASDGTETFVRYSSANGLPGDVVTGLHEDNQGRLWIVTGKGVGCRMTDGTFVVYDCDAGQVPRLFSDNASAIGRDGRLVCGTFDGLMVVDPSKINTVRNDVGYVRLTGLSVNGMDTPLPSSEQKVTMHERDRFIEIGFSALDYGHLNNDGRYSCRLKGYDGSWDILPAGRHHVRYTGLPPGDYTFEVRYSVAGMGEDALPIASVKIEVVPVLYKRWWFIALSVIMIGCIVWLIYRWRVRDLTRQKEALQMAVDNRTRQVQALTNERINFFTSITHEFRTPVTLISGPVKKALKLSTNPKVIEQLSLVEENSRYLLSLINQIMDFRKVESGRMDAVIHGGDFRSFVNGVFNSFVPLAHDLGIEMRMFTHIPDEEFGYAEDAIHKILINLLSNALKYTPRGRRVDLFVAVYGLTGSVSGGRLYICVRDTGQGISPDDIDHLFDRFYQGSGSPLNPVGGTSGSGIGLYMCRRMAEICGGTIYARNNHGPGCSMRVLLPVKLEEPVVLTDSNCLTKDVSKTTDEDLEMVHNRETLRTVLVVEDNMAMRRFIRSILIERYAVIEAANGKDALALLVHNSVDFIISDLMMPVMDGHEFSRRLKSDIATSHIPVLILTAKASAQTRLESYRIGADEYLSKPFDEDILLARIDNILENKRRYQNRFISDMKVESLNVADDSIDKQFLDRVMSVVKENYGNSEFDVAGFADALGVSRNVLNQKLQSIAGQTAWQFIITYRMNLARELIIGNRGRKSMNVSEIAYEVGFSDPKYFSKSFSRHFGISPGKMLAGEESGQE